MLVCYITGSWWSPGGCSEGTAPEKLCGLFSSGGQINSLKNKKLNKLYNLFWMQVQHQHALK